MPLARNLTYLDWSLNLSTIESYYKSILPALVQGWVGYPQLIELREYTA